MIQLPQLSRYAQQTLMTSEFLGLDRRDRIGDGQMEEDLDVSPDSWPVLCGRSRRSTVLSGGLTPAVALTEKGAVIWVRGGTVYINSSAVAGVTLSTLPAMMPKQLVSMGALLVIWPDKIWINTQDPTKHGTIDQTNTLSAGGSVTFYPCMADGTDFNFEDYQVTTSDTPPSEPDDGDWWIDTSSVPHGLYRYAASTGEWSGISATYIRIAATDIGKGLNVYDGVTLSGITISDQAVKDQLEGLNGSGHPLYAADDDYIVVAGMLDKVYTWTLTTGQSMTVARKSPDLDYICELDNRLWGCKYGLSGGEVVNEICCSALGDPRVWDRFMGGTTDSYRVTVGSDGVFTGITAHLGYVLAWKEDCLHRLYGNQPSNYQLATINCEGVQKGSWQSVTDVNGVLYYKGRAHVLAYDGSLPQIVSDALGDVRYGSASGGCIGSVLYMSMQRHDNNAWELLTLDTARGIWHTQSGYGRYFTRTGDSLYCIDADGNIVDLTGRASGTAEDRFVWYAHFGPTGYDYSGRKYLSRYNVRCSLPAGAWMELWLKHDNEEWVQYSHTEGTGGTDTLMLPVRPKRCDHVRLGIRATSGVVIYSVARIFEAGGDGTGAIRT